MKPIKLSQPVNWKDNRAQKWMKWLLYGNDKRTARDKFLESRVSIFPEKGFGLSQEDQKIIQPNY